MKTKARLIKAAAIVNYAFTALWFVVTACFFALSNNLYWMFLVFALATLYTGFVTMSESFMMFPHEVPTLPSYPRTTISISAGFIPCSVR